MPDVGEYYIRYQTGSARSNVSNTTASDVTYNTAGNTVGTGWTWSSPELETDTAGRYLVMFDIGQATETTSSRLVGTLVPRLNGTTDLEDFRASHRYLRVSGGNHGCSFGAGIVDLSANDGIRVRIPGTINNTNDITDAVGTFDTNATSGGGLQMLRLPDGNYTDVERATPTASLIGDSGTQNATRPWLDSTGSWTKVTYDTEHDDDDGLYSGSGGDITLKANKKYLIVGNYSCYANSSLRQTFIWRLNIDGTNVQYVSAYHRNTGSTGPPPGPIMYLHEVGGTNETMYVEATIEQEGTNVSPSSAYMRGRLQVVELPSSAEWIHVDNGTTDSLDTALSSTSTWYDTPLSSTYRADGNSDFSLDSVNDAVQNDAGVLKGVLAIGWHNWDRNGTTSGTRKMPWAAMNVGGIRLRYGWNSAYSRGSQSSDDTWHASYVVGAVTFISNGADLKFQVNDAASGVNADMGLWNSYNRHFCGLQVMDLSTIEDTAVSDSASPAAVSVTTSIPAVSAVAPQDDIAEVDTYWTFDSTNDNYIGNTTINPTGDLLVEAKVKFRGATGIHPVADDWWFAQTKKYLCDYSAGDMRMWTSGTGGGDSFATSTAGLDATYSTDDVIHLRWFYDASESEVTFWHRAEDSDAWTQLGAAVSVNQTALNSTSTGSRVGHGSGATGGRTHWVEWRSGTGTLLGRASANDAVNTSSSFTGNADGLTWTQAGATFTLTGGPIGVTATLPAVTATGTSNATASPGVVAVSVSLPAVTASGTSNATASPGVVSVTTAIPAATASEGSVNDSATAPLVSVTTAVLAVTASKVEDRVASPGLLAVAVATPNVSASGTANATASPGVVSVTVSYPAVTASGTSNATASPAVTIAGVTIPAATATGTANAVASPDAVAVSVGLPAVTASGTANATASPGVVAVSVALPAATASVVEDRTASPGVLSVTTAIPAVTTDAYTNDSTSPAVVAVTVGLPATSGKSDTASPGLLSVTVDVPQVAAASEGNAVATPELVSVTTAFPAVSLSADSQISAPLVSASVTHHAATATQSSTRSPDPVAVTTAIPAASASSESGDTASPGVVSVSVGLPAVSAAAGSSVTAPLVPVSTTLYGVAASVSAIANPAGSEIPIEAKAGTSITINAAGDELTAGGSGAHVVDVAIPDVTASASATATPGVVTVATVIPAVTATGEVGDTASPDLVNVTVGLPAVTAVAEQGDTASPAVVSVTTAIPAVTAVAGADATANPAAVSVTVTHHAVTTAGENNAITYPDPTWVNTNVLDVAATGTVSDVATPGVVSVTVTHYRAKGRRYATDSISTTEPGSSSSSTEPGSAASSREPVAVGSSAESGSSLSTTEPGSTASTSEPSSTV